MNALALATHGRISSSKTGVSLVTGGGGVVVREILQKIPKVRSRLITILGEMEDISISVSLTKIEDFRTNYKPYENLRFNLEESI